MEYLKELKQIYKAIDDKMGENITIIDISKISSLCDYFIITNGNNVKQQDAIATNIKDELGKLNIIAMDSEGSGSDWTLLNYGFAFIHIFHKESRELYELERLWSDGDFINMEKLCQ
ncbi:MAG: ribosome silencing factor [Lachnospirales bacterium]